MTANVGLLLFLLAFWIGLWLFVKLDRLVHRRPLSEGPSFVPVVPLFPFFAFGVGWLLNRIHPWLGTGIVAVSHLGYLLASALSARRNPDPPAR